MRRANKIYLIIAVILLASLILSSCAKDQNIVKDPTDNKEAEVKEPADNNDDKQDEIENKAKEDVEDEIKEEVEKKEFEKLDIIPTIDLEKNVDYIESGEKAIDFELVDLNGNNVKLSDYKGQIVFLNFWATWCPPCRYEMPDMENVHKEYGDKGVIILGVNSTANELRGGRDSNKAEKQVRSYIEDEGYTFSIPLDRDDSVAIEYNQIYPMTGIPTTYMIDREGIVRFVRPGAFLNEEQIKAFAALLDK